MDTNEFNQLPISKRMRQSESYGGKIAIIINKAVKKCNELLKPTGYGINIKVEFCKLENVHDSIEEVPSDV